MQATNRPEDRRLVPQLELWEKQLGEPVSLEEWVAVMGDPQLAIGYLRVFWPPFVEHKEGVFLQWHFTEQSYDEWRVIYDETPHEVERAMNHFSLIELFTEPEKQAQLEVAQLQFIGEHLRAIWEAKLHRDFPTRHFAVELSTGEEPENVVLSFHQPPAEDPPPAPPLE